MYNTTQSRAKKPAPIPSVSRPATGRGVILGIRTGNSFGDGLIEPEAARETARQINEILDEQEAEPASVMDGEPVTEIATPFAGWPVPVHLIDAAPVSIL
jgi:hypothetical protein